MRKAGKENDYRHRSAAKILITNKYPQKMAKIVIPLIIFLTTITMSIGQESISSDTASLSVSTNTTNMKDNNNENELEFRGFFCEKKPGYELITKSSYSGSENNTSCHESESVNIKMSSYFETLNAFSISPSLGFVASSQTDETGKNSNTHYEDFEDYEDDEYCEYDEDCEDYEVDIDYEDDKYDGHFKYAGGGRKQGRIPLKPEEYPIPPSDLVYPISIAYDESFLMKLGSEAACVEYINKVLPHTQGRLKDESLRSKLHLDVKQMPRFLPNILLKVDHEDLNKIAYRIPSNESLVIFVDDVDDDEAMGVTKTKAGCDPFENKIIVKYRSSPQKAGIALAHEFGHLTLGLNHDDTEDSKIERKIVSWTVSGKCDTGNTMMSRTPSMDGSLPTWSECNRFRFDKFYDKIGRKCLETASSPKIERPDGVEKAVSAGGTILLTCKTYGAPKPDLQWYHGIDKLHSEERHTVYEDGSLEIRDIQFEDAGEYTCNATNFLGYTTTNMTLNIQESEMQEGEMLSPVSLGIIIMIAYLAICILILFVLHLKSFIQVQYESYAPIADSPIATVNDEEETTETSRTSTHMKGSRAAITMEVNRVATSSVTSCAATAIEASKDEILFVANKSLIERGLRYSQSAMLQQQGKSHELGRRRVHSL